LRARSAEERELLRRQVFELYEDFVRKAAAGRGVPADELRKVAEGRVWSGLAAQERCLVDRLGGLDDAVARAGELAGLGVGEARRLTFPVQVRPLERLLGGSPLAAGARLSSGAQLVCPVRVPLR
jgi:protease-4